MIIRFDSRMKMIIEELAKKQKATNSEIVRLLCNKAIEEIEEESS